MQTIPAGTRIIADTTGVPGGSPPPQNFGAKAFGIVQVSQAQGSYFLDYKTPPPPPPPTTPPPGASLQKLTLGRGMWPNTPDCGSINLNSSINLNLGNFLYV